MKEFNWEIEVNRIIKAEMAKKGVSYKVLADLLRKIGVDENEDSIESKIRRGTFRASFLLQCMKALNCNQIEVFVESKAN